MALFDAHISTAESYDIVIEQMERHRIYRGLVSTTKPLKHMKSDKLIPCRIVTPETAPDEFGEEVPAVRVFPIRDNFELTCDFIGSFDVPIFIDLDQIEPQHLDKVLEENPTTPFVLTRVSYRAAHWLFEMLPQRQNLHLELSWFFYYGGVQKLVEDFGSDRFLFGTTMPERDPGAAIGMLKYAQISDEARTKIGSENLERLLG